VLTVGDFGPENNYSECAPRPAPPRARTPHGSQSSVSAPCDEEEERENACWRVTQHGGGARGARSRAAQLAMNSAGKAPALCSEYYAGWYTAWGQPRAANTSGTRSVATLAAMLREGFSSAPAPRFALAPRRVLDALAPPARRRGEFGRARGSVSVYMAH
jgi:hypothetical protein